MPVKIQLLALIFSFLYGIFYNYIYCLFNQKAIKFKKIWYLVSKIIFIIIIYLLYLFLMYYINYGDLHIYFIGILIIGYLTSNYVILSHKSLKKIKKKI